MNDKVSNKINNDEEADIHTSNVCLNDHFASKGKIIVKKKRRLKKWVWDVLLIFFLLLIIHGVYRLVLWNNDNVDTEKIIDQIQNDIVVLEKEDNDNTEFVGQPELEEEEIEEVEEEVLNDYWYYVKFPLIDVDINSLKSKNSDTIGWINVNNTNINYPYVQTNNNSYYLNHSFDKSYNDAGWVFMDYRNNSNLDNKNTILYAHSRLDKTMFGSLSKVLRSAWYTNKDNHIIRISTEAENTLWQIFSVYKIKEEAYYITTDFDDDYEYSEFLNTLKQRSLYNFNTNLTSDDRILTLSTCYDDTIRTVVHAKLIKKSMKE